ncbi:MAG: DUF2750 domain-containing protein [Xanthomonadales bacterium PRO6]|nr:hypothetical protein [Xanthomonadales bacterium]MCE7932559.1 DUF2750 domain-containing protein [Xanthomonadales bacterium PRO6]
MRLDHQGNRMTYALTPAEFRRVSRLPGEARLDEFIGRVAMHGQVWGLRSESGWAVVQSEGDDCFPVWPHPDFASAWAVGELADCTPQAIALDAWLQRWIPGMQGDGTLVLVFPTDEDDDGGVVIAPEDLAEEMRGALG